MVLVSALAKRGRDDDGHGGGARWRKAQAYASVEIERPDCDDDAPLAEMVGLSASFKLLQVVGSDTEMRNSGTRQSRACAIIVLSCNSSYCFGFPMVFAGVVYSVGVWGGRK